jgi:hypothetical protein
VQGKLAKEPNPISAEIYWRSGIVLINLLRTSHCSFKELWCNARLIDVLSVNPTCLISLIYFIFTTQQVICSLHCQELQDHSSTFSKR